MSLCPSWGLPSFFSDLPVCHLTFAVAETESMHSRERMYHKKLAA